MCSYETAALLLTVFVQAESMHKVLQPDKTVSQLCHYKWNLSSSFIS